jgi:hypothetical protein
MGWKMQPAGYGLPNLDQGIEEFLSPVRVRGSPRAQMNENKSFVQRFSLRSLPCFCGGRASKGF